MTIAELCIPAFLVLIIVSIGIAKADGLKTFDNANPRDPDFYRPGLRRRAQAAHENGWEGFPFFIAAILLAEIRGVGQGVVDGMAVGFVVLRIAYLLMYLGNRPTLRSVVWGLAMVCNLTLFFSPLWAR